MKRLSALLAALTLNLPSGASALEALDTEAKTLGPAKEILTVMVGKDSDGFGSGLKAAFESGLDERGYAAPKLPTQHEITQGKSTGSALPKFSKIEDLAEWLKEGHTVHAAAMGGLIGVATAIAKTKVNLDGVLAVESKKASGGGGFLKKAGKLAGVPGAAKAAGDEVYEYRVSLLSEKGQVVWSQAGTVDKESLEKAAGEREDKKIDEMQGKMGAKMQEMQPQMQAQAGAAAAAPAAKAQADALAKLTPEQRAMVEQSMKSAPPGGAAAAGPGSAQFGSGMFGKIAKMSKKTADVGGPENWGPFVAEERWGELESFLPKREKAEAK